MTNLRSIAEYRKTVVAGCGAAVMLVTSGLSEFAAFLPSDATRWANVGVAFVTAVSVYLVKNAEVIDNVGRDVSG